MDFSLIKDIINLFSQLCAGPINYIRELQENLKTLRTSIEKLKDVRDDVIARVETQEANGMRRTNRVAGWLDEAGVMEVEVEGILREGYEEIEDRFLGGFCPKNCYASYKLGEKVSRKIKDVDKLKDQERSFELVAEPLPPPSVQGRLTEKVTGMDLMFEKAWSCVNNENVGIMGIYGIGGVGKTTLLTQINNEFLSRQIPHFDVVIWVVVSKEVNTKNIQDDVAKRLGLSLPKDESLHDRALKIHSALRKKRFVILMDDIWEPVDLTTKIGIPLPDIKNKSKVVFTTRSLDVCKQMKAREQIKVECLDSAEAWKLFQEAFGDEALLNSHSEIREIAKQIAKECGGLPLALITTGKAMAGMDSPQEWRRQQTILKKYASEFSGMEEKVYSILKLSYDRLRDDTVRSCFLYCSMFPEDHSIEIEQLIRYWIGEGFLDGFDNIDEAEDEGYAIVGILKRACLLESTGLDSPRTKVKMHDVLRDLALWIGCEDGKKKNKLLVQAGVHLAEAPKVGKWREAERISLMDNDLETLGEEAPKCPNLLTLIISKNRDLGNIFYGFFQHMNDLRVLDLSDTGIEVLPTSIVKLVELEYLGLARTKITKLPQEMKSLVKLKCLDLSSTSHLKFIPCGILSKFSGLQVLDFSGSNFEHWEAESNDIGQDEGNVGASIKELECLKDLQDLSIKIRKVACLHRILASEDLVRCTRRLYIEDCEILIPEILMSRSLSKNRRVTIDGTTGCFPNLRKVRFYNCNALKDLSWLCGAPKLEKLSVRGCECLELICNGTAGCFPNLREVDIYSCEALKDLSGLCGAPNLEKLSVGRCKCLELICDRMAGCFPNLREVHIYYCKTLKDLSGLCGAPNLEKLSVDHCECLELRCDRTAGCFPNLRKVDIKCCNALKDLSCLCGAPNLEELHVRRCECLELICDGTARCFPNLRKVDIRGCNALKDLSGLCGAPDLEKLSVDDCECLELRCDRTAGCFPNLREVDINGCNALKDLSGLCGAPNLEKLSVSSCECLELICDGRAGCLPNLREVNINYCHVLKDLSWLYGAPNLEKLRVSWCECLELKYPELICDGTTGCFPNLRVVYINGCNALKDLSWLCGAPNLEELDVCNYKHLKLICDRTVGCFQNLRKVDIMRCNALKNLSWLCGAPNLEELDVSFCDCLELICDGEDAEVKESPLKFSRLSLLSLSDLPELKRIPWHAIPPGTRTTIESCPKATPPNEPKHLESNEIIRKRKMKFKMKFKVGRGLIWGRKRNKLRCLGR